MMVHDRGMAMSKLVLHEEYSNINLLKRSGIITEAFRLNDTTFFKSYWSNFEFTSFLK